MKLSKLTERIDFTLVRGSLDTEISDVVFDSRKAGPGTAFIAINGFRTDSHKFLKQVAEKGAAAVVIEKDMSNLKSMIVDLYDIVPRKLTKYVDTTLATACEAKKCIGLAEASRNSEERAEYLKTARVFVEDIIDDATILSHKKRISKKTEQQIKAQARKVVAQCVAWRDYTNDQGAE